ncbi:MAG TPA: ATP-binding protein, partial [Gallionellaceae bacterium]
QQALERLGAIRIRSDVERKRLHGLAPLAASSSQPGAGLYGADATRLTYARLLELARDLLGAGYSVIVDAAFLKRDERAQLRQLARQLDAPFAIASVRASEATLHARIGQRQRSGTDASEADLAVLELLQEKQEPLSSAEESCTVMFDNESAGFAAAAWQALERLLHSSTT